MDPNFWHERWKNNQIGFHIKKTNPFLVQFFPKLNLQTENRILLPLCGKTLDIHWLLEKGFFVLGVELSSIAVTQLFDELGVKPEIEDRGDFISYSAEGICIYVGDFFNLSSEILGPVDAIYDRAALVALPFEMRKKYTRKLMEVTDSAPQLLICFEYNENSMDGPPFSISDEEIKNHYKEKYHLEKILKQSIIGGIREGIPAVENVWLLSI